MTRPLGAVAALVVLLAATAVGIGASSRGPVSPPSAEAASAAYVAQVQSLYAQDLVARINAERAARSTAGAGVPPLQVDPGLQAAAQSWSGHLAATGTVADPTLTGCAGVTGGQQCLMASNTGTSGNGYWPGDGSDGMNGAYMGSGIHRQNELNAAYTGVGIGVTCSGGQAYTVELFGFSPAQIAQANAREVVQSEQPTSPASPSPVVAAAPTGDPVYCPGQTVGTDGRTTAMGGQFPYPFSVPAVPGEPNGATSDAGVSVASTADGGGYWVARANGTVSTHGDAVSHGSMAGQHLNAAVTHIVATPDGGGYWLVAADGGVFAFGDAGFYGSMGGKALNGPIVDLAPTADGRGYWEVGADGGVFSFGDARYQGSMGGSSLNAAVVGMAADPATGGYWLVAADGGVFAYDAPYRGSTGSMTLNQPVVGMAATTDDGGYWFVAADGGVFSFGDANFHGSAATLELDAPMVGMAADPATGGYWLVAADGGVFSYDAPFYGAG